MYPADYRYTKEHEWIKVQGDVGTIGITDYAQQELGDVVFVDTAQSRREAERRQIVWHRGIGEGRQRNLQPRFRRSHRNESAAGGHAGKNQYGPAQYRVADQD